MRKALLFALMITLCLPLGGCGGEAAEEQQAEEVQLKFQDFSAATIEAELTCHYGEEVHSYTLRCTYSPEESTVEVLEPADLAGISATLSGEDLTVQYAGILLDAGTYSGTEISPMWALPSLLQAIRQGYPLESCQEEWGEAACLRVTFETTGGDGSKRYYAVWFDESGTPLQGEITLGDTVVYTAVLTQFTAEETDNGATTAEDMGGD